MTDNTEQGKIRFDGKSAIVTGAGGGLGRTYAIELAKRGAKVVVNDLGGAADGSGEGSASPADRVVEEIKALGGEAVACYDSVATPEGGEAIVNKALEAFGSVDIVINNAGILRDKSLVKMVQEDWDLVLSVHLNGAFNVTRPAFKKMKENGYGRIVMTASGAGLYGNFGQTNYCAAKMGVVGFMNALKLEGAKYNIKVNTVAPMATTRLTAGSAGSGGGGEGPDPGSPDLVAPFVLYLCSEACAETGMIFNAGLGHFNRVALVTGPGFSLEDVGKIPEPELIQENIRDIKSLEGGKEFSHVFEFAKSVHEE